MDFGPDALQLFSRGLRLKAPLGFWQENLRASLKKKALVSCYWKTRKETSKGALCQTFVLATNEFFLSVVYNMVIRP